MSGAVAIVGGCLGLPRPVNAWRIAGQDVRRAGEGGFVQDRRAAREGRANISTRQPPARQARREIPFLEPTGEQPWVS